MRRRIAALTLTGALAGVGTLVAASAKVDACRLIKPAEIAAVQGAAVTHSKATQRASGGFLFAQCYYLVATGDRSVSLEVTLADRAHARPASPARHWRQSFHAEPGEKGEKKGEEKDADPPRPVAGLGEEAFWVGDRVMGALYVLKGDRYLRISVGGSDEAALKIERGKVLAAKALGRL